MLAWNNNGLKNDDDDDDDDEPVSTEKRVAIVLNWLSSGCSYNQVGQIFGVHKATVIKFVNI